MAAAGSASNSSTSRWVLPGSIVLRKIRTCDFAPARSASAICPVTCRTNRKSTAPETVEGVPTTRELALEVLASEPFRSGDYSTSTLDTLRAVAA